MAQATESAFLDAGGQGMTVNDLAERFGPLPLARIRFNPFPGTATEQDVVEIREREDRLYELVDGVLVEKAMGAYESYLAMLLGRLLGNHVADGKLGVILGADGMMRLMPGLIRIPDLSFIVRERLPGGRVPRTPMAERAPDLAVEVISKSNTPREMAQKLEEYFAAGAREVWHIYPDSRELHLFTAADTVHVYQETDVLCGTPLLPGFRLSLAEYFAEPAEE